ncbi:MAG: aspartyl protease family protein [Verrucomicrobiota bacterium]|jgi:hypothetical protein
MRIICAIVAAICTIILCSCATQESIHPPLSIERPPLPPEASFNKTAGRGGVLLITLLLKDGATLPFMLDTGAPATILDESLDSRLGKCLGTNQFGYRWFGTESVRSYKAPKLCMGGVKLLTCDSVMTGDLTRILPNHQIMGILGMDCLRRYCIQLDFAANRIRFLDPDHLDTNDLGNAFPLTIFAGNASTRGNMFGQRKARFCVDTGCNVDGMLKPTMLRREMRKQTVGSAGQIKSPAGATVNQVFFDKFLFNDNACYHDVNLVDGVYGNIIGLHFLARHLVTLDFPRQTMYLQRWSDESFVDEAREFLKGLKDKGQLPGLSKGARGHFYNDWLLVKPSKSGRPQVYPVSRLFYFWTASNSFRYNYTVVLASQDSEWKLQRAWRTDANGKMIEEYPVP